MVTEFVLPGNHLKHVKNGQFYGQFVRKVMGNREIPVDFCENLFVEFEKHRLWVLVRTALPRQC